MKNKKINNAIGSQLKIARKNKGWSLDTTCLHTGVSKAMLGQIERAESSPTVAKLWDIANGFGLPLSYFLMDLTTNQQPKDVKQAELVTEDGLIISTLFSFNEITNIEVFSLSLSPMYQHISLPHNDGVIEHIIVVEGQIEYFSNNKWQPLYTGDAVKFNADEEHGYRNISSAPAVFQNIIYYPKV